MPDRVLCPEGAVCDEYFTSDLVFIEDFFFTRVDMRLAQATRRPVAFSLDLYSPASTGVSSGTGLNELDSTEFTHGVSVHSGLIVLSMMLL